MVEIRKNYESVVVKFVRDEPIVTRTMDELFKSVVDPTGKARSVFWEIMRRHKKVSWKNGDLIIVFELESEFNYSVSVHVPDNDPVHYRGYQNSLSKAIEVLPEMLPTLLRPFLEAARDYVIQRSLNDA